MLGNSIREGETSNGSGVTGKKVIMNGGAHGLGLASLSLFAESGADVAFFSRKDGKIEAAKAAIDAVGPGKVFAEVFDMNDGGDAYKAWIEKAAGELGGCDIFIHTASTSGARWHRRLAGWL